MESVKITLPAKDVDAILPEIILRGDIRSTSQSEDGSLHIVIDVDDSDEFMAWFKKGPLKEVRRIRYSDLPAARQLLKNSPFRFADEEIRNIALAESSFVMVSDNEVQAILVVDVVHNIPVVVDLAVSDRGSGLGYTISNAFAVDFLEANGYTQIFLPGNPPLAIEFVRKWLKAVGLSGKVQLTLQLASPEVTFRGHSMCVLSWRM